MQFVSQDEYARQAAEASGGAASAGGMAYPLYGIPPLGQVAPEPFYRRPLVCFAAGAAVVGAAWLYFGWWKPKQGKVKKNEGEEA